MLIPESVRLLVCFVMCVFVSIVQGSTCIILFSRNRSLISYILYVMYFSGYMLLFFSLFIYMFKMMSLNVRGLSNFKKRKLIFSWCRKTKSDIIFLQEMRSKFEVQKQWEREWGETMFFSHGSKNARGVAILFRSGFDTNIDAVKRDGQGRLLVIKGKLEDSAFAILNIFRTKCGSLFAPIL